MRRLSISILCSLALYIYSGFTIVLAGDSAPTVVQNIDSGADSSSAVADSLLSDSSAAPDTTLIDTSLIDTSLIDTMLIDTSLIDTMVIDTTLTDSSAQTPDDSLQILENESTSDSIVIPPLRFVHLAARSLLSPTRSLRRDLDRSFYHDAADFLRADRTFFTVDYLPTPLRHTVSAFGLPGPRVTPIFDGRPLEISEQLIEQDGLIDFNDVPTASVTDAYAISGPLASFLGGESAVAGVWLEKVRASGPLAESHLEAQKGSFGYAYTKGVFSEQLDNGFAYTAALGYRKTNYLVQSTDDYSYHQFWEVETPLAKRWRVTSSVRLYRRRSDYLYRPATVSRRFDRDRRDLDYLARIERPVDSNKTYTLEYRRQHSESRLDDKISSKSEIDNLKHTVSLALARRSGRRLLQVKAVGKREEHTVASGSNSRNRGQLSLKVLWGQTEGEAVSPSLSSAAIYYGELAAVYVGGYSVLPRLSAGAVSSSVSGTVSRRFSLSISMTPVFPRQYELDHPGEDLLSGLGVDDLRQVGNPNLLAERQHTVAAEFSLAGAKHDLSLSATAGWLQEGINWRSTTLISGGRTFSPLNEDVRFASVALKTHLTLSGWLSWVGSGAYYAIEYDSTPSPAYTPKYNLYTAAYLKKYINALELFLTGQVEMSFVGAYDGYDGSFLGQQPIFGAKFSARIKSFTFHYIFEDALNTVYYAREQYPNIGRYNWYWFTWSFLD